MKNNLGELRDEKGLSQKQLAEKLDVTRQTVNSIETGRYNPSLDLAFDLAEFFDCSIEDIFLREG